MDTTHVQKNVNIHVSFTWHDRFALFA